MFSELRWLLLPAVFLFSCSVKEDRSRCPCVLEVSVTGAPARLRCEGEDYREERDCPRDTLLRLGVPRSGVMLTALRGAERGEEGGVRIPPGYESPPLWLDALHLDTDGEAASAALHPHKAFCSLTVVCDGPPGGGEPYWVEIIGNVNGWEADGTLSEGPFSCRCIPGPDGRFTVRLPRQRDASLRMDILFSDRIVRSFALGTALARDGYDWSAQDLPDRELTLRLSLTDIALDSDLWSEKVLLDFEI